jgi:hypothetical protein
VAPSIPKSLVMTRKIRHRSAAVPQRHTRVVAVEVEAVGVEVVVEVEVEVARLAPLQPTPAQH